MTSRKPGVPMNEPLRPPPRAAHRFVPTLTEVVLPHPAMAAPAADPITPEQLETITDAALRRAEASLTQKLPEVLAALLHEQALALSERMRREISATVRQAVTETLAERLPDGRGMRKSGEMGKDRPGTGVVSR